MEDERRLDWDWKLGLGIASPVDIMLSLYPHMSEAEAEEKIRKNLAGRREQVMGEIGGRREVRPAAEVDMADADEDEDEEDEEDGEED